MRATRCLLQRIKRHAVASHTHHRCWRAPGLLTHVVDGIASAETMPLRRCLSTTTTTPRPSTNEPRLLPTGIGGVPLMGTVLRYTRHGAVVRLDPPGAVKMATLPEGVAHLFRRPHEGPREPIVSQQGSDPATDTDNVRQDGPHRDGFVTRLGVVRRNNICVRAPVGHSVPVFVLSAEPLGAEAGNRVPMMELALVPYGKKRPMHVRAQLQMAVRAAGFLDVDRSTSAAELEERFGMSRSQFRRALGYLLRRNIVAEVSSGGLRYVDRRFRPQYEQQKPHGGDGDGEPVSGRVAGLLSESGAALASKSEAEVHRMRLAATTYNVGVDASPVNRPAYDEEEGPSFGDVVTLSGARQSKPAPQSKPAHGSRAGHQGKPRRATAQGGLGDMPWRHRRGARRPTMDSVMSEWKHREPDVVAEASESPWDEQTRRSSFKHLES